MDKGNIYTDKPLMLRPHHCVCLRYFEGRGYSPEFTENMAAVLRRLQSAPHTVIELTHGPDDLCARCPHLSGECVSAEKVRKLDSGWAGALGLAPGVSLPWSEIESAGAEIISRPGVFEGICSECQWFDICRRIRGERGESPSNG